jgi:hypothetical protein
MVAGKVTYTERRRVMKIRVVLAAVVLGLAVVTVTLAQQQAGDAVKRYQDRRPGLRPGPTMTLRDQVAKLRAEVELLELEHDVDRAHLSDLLKEQRHSDSIAERTAKAKEGVNNAITMAASIGKLDEIKKEFGDEKAMQSLAEKELKELAERGRTDIERKKKAFLSQATELNGKRLALAELEKQLASVK